MTRTGDLAKNDALLYISALAGEFDAEKQR